jgi:hypothetical protein
VVGSVAVLLTFVSRSTLTAELASLHRKRQHTRHPHPGQ